MKCDKCGEDVGSFKATKGDGTVLCLDCTKGAVKRKTSVAPTKDKFILLCRKLQKVGRVSSLSSVYAMDTEGRCYTEGTVLLSEVDSVSSDAEFIELLTLKSNKTPLPNVSEIIKSKNDNPYYVNIPGIVYSLLKVFSDSGTMFATFENGVLKAEDINDETVLEYTGVDMDVPTYVRLSIPKLLILKPSRLEFLKDIRNVRAVSSYDPTVNAIKHVIFAGIQQ